VTRSAAWLRDSCVCPECRDAVSGQHLLDVGDLHGWHVVSETPDTAELEHRDGTRHTCVLTGAGRAAGPLPDDGAGLTRRCSPDPRPHSVGYLDEAWITDVATQVIETGAALVTGVPGERGTVLDVAEHLGFVRATNYGVLFDVEAVADPNNLAYSALALPLHTDNPYRDPTPTVQLLHCLRPSPSGGETILADGFSAAEQLRSSDPAAFDALVSTPVRFRFADATTDLSAVRSIIELDAAGEVSAVHVNHRSMLAPSPDANVETFYAAYQAFVAHCADDTNCAGFTLDAGELLVFDNRRMLHARGKFPAGDGRHLQGCYIDIDALSSAANLAHRIA